MKKLRLDDLHVDSFDTTGNPAPPRGTVRAHATENYYDWSCNDTCWGGTGCPSCAGTCYGQYTCDGYNTCPGAYTCQNHGTCANTCDLMDTCGATLCDYTCNGQKTCDLGGCGAMSADCW